MLLFELVASLVCVGAFAAIFVMALNIPYPANAQFWSGGGAFPLVVGAVLTLCALWRMADVALQMRKRRAAGVRDGEEERKSLLETLIGSRNQQKRLLLVMVLTLVFVFVLVPLFGRVNRQFGFSAANFLFLLVSISLFGETSRVKAVGISAVSSVIIFAVFSYVLKLPMPR